MANSTAVNWEDFFKRPDQFSACQKLIQNKANILISGGTGSGKTTFAKKILEVCAKDEHLILLEDTHELSSLSPIWTHLLANSGPRCSLKDYCNYALRMRPDRIILGEIRASEVVPFLLAMNTGHRGLLSTIHANSAKDSLYRLALLFYPL